MENEITEITKKLIGFKTINGRDRDMAGCLNYVKRYFARETKEGKIIVRNYRKNNLLSVILANKKTLSYDVILAGHIDVVSGSEEDFKPKIKGGKLYARGAADMKGEVASMMAAFRDFVNSGRRRNIALMLTSDEEMGGQSGVGYLVNEIGYRAKVAVAPDGGHDFELVVKEKGGFWIKIISRGKSAHGSRPWFGENAILKLVEFYQDVEKVFPPFSRKKVLYRDGVSVNLGRLSGGASINSVPDYAEMFLDMRYSERKDKKRIEQEIRRLCRKHGLEFCITDVVDLLETNPQDRYLREFRAIAKKIAGRPIKITKATGASDARFFSARGMPVIIMVPNCGRKHSPDEWVEVKALEKFYRIIREFLIHN